MICKKCGKEINDLMFCKYCGTFLKEGFKVCRFCNSLVDDDSLFCGHCGKSLKENIKVHFSIPSLGAIFPVNIDKNDKNSTYENILMFLKKEYMKSLDDDVLKKMKFSYYDDRGRNIIFRDNSSFDKALRFNSDRLDEYFFDGASIVISFDED